MRVTFEIEDAVLPSIERYLAVQVRVKPDEVTGAQVHERIYEDVEHLLQEVVGQTVHQIVQQYPTDAIRAKLAAAKKLHDEIKAEAAPRRVKPA